MSRLFETRPGDDGLPGPQRRIAVIVLIFGTLMAVIDATMINIALPSIARDLKVGASRVVWITNLYQLVGAMSLIAFAALSELVTRRLLYIAGLAMFALASLGCALARDLEWLLMWRALQGLGAAAMLSIGPSLYRSIFPSRLLGSALGISAMVVAFGYASGPSLGGVVLAIADWPWLFALNVPVGVVVGLLAWRALPREERRSGGFDLLGALLSAVALGALVVAMDGVGHGAGTLQLFGLLLLGGGSGWAFVLRQRRVTHPLLPLSIFAEVRFSMAAVVSGLAFVAQGLAFVCLSFLYQNVMGYTPLETAWLFTPWPLVIMMVAPLAGRIADRVEPAMLASLGLGILLLGLVSLALLEANAAVIDILWRTALCGLGFGLFQSPNNREFMASVPRTFSASASGVLSTVRTFGQSLGVALVGLVLAWPQGNVQAALWLGSAAGLSALLVSLGRLRLRPTSQT
ncbi:MFS transporter, DHA2 family, multidrug resistance protein [Modicisalibacter ilicicola DSM 19980]|uniref:MFS transporter, DHA2 family, multidrug resistance protein n=1 Tax=Modicisalibacter ilicicola DSM 19980 TaxID=1121942 RepID=A0A1M4VA44_9GAMM|nr:MFS transporter [Halomonas ilicicola]SHE65747.1 MFS transporter, DHA2 family, multidrug resistance protein [Halomonas ilicicola DSM 19980]